MDFENAKYEAVELLKRLIEIPSYSREETAVADFLQSEIEALGYVACRNANNVYVKSPAFDLGKPTILLNAHLDTVKPAKSWTKNPHKATVEGDKLYGLGSNDDGASVVSLLQAFFMLTLKNQPYNLIFAATAEEEVSGKNGVESLLADLPKIDLAVVGEPTGMQMAVAEKGLMVLDCTAHGVSGHAARNEGDNAIYKAIKDIEWVRTNSLPKVSENLGPVKMTVTMIQAGTQHNVIPDTCSFVIDVRSNECYSNQEIYEILKDNLQSDVVARSFRLGSSGIDVSHPIVKRGVELGLGTFGSPTLSDQALMSFASVKIGPGDSARSHSADEYICLSEIESAIKIYYELLDGLVISK